MLRTWVAAVLVVLWLVSGPMGAPDLLLPKPSILTAEAAPGDIVEFPIPTGSSSPISIAPGADGNLWFTEYGANKVGYITPAGTITEFSVPTGNSFPEDIAPGPDGNLWFTEANKAKIAKVTPGGTIIEFPLPQGATYPSGITAGPDGNLWFTVLNGSNIGRITPAGEITLFPIPTSFSEPRRIAPGADGNLWFTELAPHKIGRITPAGVITEFPAVPGTRPFAITPGPDGNMWFTALGLYGIYRITPSGTVTQYNLPTGFNAHGIALGPDGAIWFTEQDGSGTHKVGRLPFAGGVMTHYSIPTPNSQPRGISSGPDGNLWFTEYSGNKIGRIEPGKGSAVLVLASGFSPKNRSGRQGRPVQWIFSEPNDATVTDASGMGLFDSGVKRLLSYYSFTFIAAGTYPYKNQLAPTQKGRIKIDLRVRPTSGPPSTVFKVIWASEAPPPPYVFDVQILRPGGFDFVDWRTGVIATRAEFTPDGGPGTYMFRARIRNTLNDAASGYSPGEPVTVTP